MPAVIAHSLKRKDPALLLIALPFVLFLVMLHIQPSYVSALWTHPTGQMMSIFAVVMQILGALVIRKIVNIKV